MLDANKLRGLIVSKGFTQKEFADIIGMTPKTLYLKMKNGTFGLDEADKIIEILDIDDPVPIFFANKVT